MPDNLLDNISSDLQRRGIELHDRIEEAPEQVDGAVVLVDVLRFSTSACVLFERGAGRLRTYPTLDSARSGQENGQVDVLVGEEDGQRADGFDYDNSPGDLQHASFDDERIGVVTTNGTRGLQAIDADRYYIGSTYNARTLGRSLPDGTAIIACGHRGEYSPEDQLGAALIGAYAVGYEPTEGQLSKGRRIVRESIGGQMLTEHGYKNDVELAMQFSSSERRPVSSDGVEIYDDLDAA